MPNIGVSASNLDETQSYLKSIESRGATTSLILPGENTPAEDIIQGIDALLLSGGPDIDPTLYHQTPDPMANLEVDRARDDLELDLFRAALTRDIPILGICRGMQLINVAMGGALIQDLPEHTEVKWDGLSESAYHRVYLSPGSKLAAIIGSGGLFRVNSRHHQGLKEAQKSIELLTSVYSLEDGIIEGLEMPGNRWVIGLQCHPELEEESPKIFGNIFEAFVERAELISEKAKKS